jgi:hypothetical protein
VHEEHAKGTHDVSLLECCGLSAVIMPKYGYRDEFLRCRGREKNEDWRGMKGI